VTPHGCAALRQVELIHQICGVMVMADPLIGKTEIRAAGDHVVFTFDPDVSPIKVRAQEANGWLRMELAGNVLSFARTNSFIDPVLKLDGQNAVISVGGQSATGKLVVRELHDKTTVELDGFGKLTLGGNDHHGGITLKANDGKTTLSLGGGGITAGGDGTAGSLTVVDDKTRKMFEARAADGQLTVGGFTRAGRLVARASDGSAEAIVLDAKTADVTAGHTGQPGTLVLKGANGQQLIKLDAANEGTLTLLRNGQPVIELDCAKGEVRVGGGGPPGAIVVRDANAQDTIHLRASDALARVGGNGRDGRVRVFRANNTVSLELNATSGDIILQNADCAEDFDLADAAEADPGSVMVLDDQGRLRPGCQAYDTRVVGVVAGAGGFRPGIVLDRTASRVPRAPLSMVGKAFCKVDATTAAIASGDLLTSSPRPGHAMKASDPARSFGAVLGKALSPLAGGTGLIPIVVALQ
jgi:hypothetical protein